MPWVMKMDAARSSETSVNIYPTSRRHIPEERHLLPSRLALHRHAPGGTKERHVHSNLLPADIQTQYLSSVNHTRRDISQQLKGREGGERTAHSCSRPSGWNSASHPTEVDDLKTKR